MFKAMTPLCTARLTITCSVLLAMPSVEGDSFVSFVYLSNSENNLLLYVALGGVAGYKDYSVYDFAEPLSSTLHPRNTLASGKEWG